MQQQQPSRWLKIGLAVALLFLLTGLALHSFLGKQFLPAYSPPPAAIAIGLLVGALLLLSALESCAPFMRHRIPTAWLRWLAWPLFTLATAGVLYLSSQGWIAGTSRVLAHDEGFKELNVLGNRRYETRRALCLQYVELEYQRSAKEMCADGLLVDDRRVDGKSLLAKGLVSPLGFHVQQFRAP